MLPAARRASESRLQPRSRRRVAVFAAATLLIAASWVVGAVAPAGALPPTPVCAAGSCTITFAETGAPQAWTVPAGVTSVTMAVAAGSGGNDAGFGPGFTGGAGGKVTATVPVTAGHDLSIVVGAQGANGVIATPNVPAVGGYGGGGNAGSETDPSETAGGSGGGGSFVFDTTAGPGTLLLAAGGGGGGAGDVAGGNGGAGGAGGNGSAASGVLPGQGATTSAGGAGGTGATAGSPGTGPATSDTALGVGGTGAIHPSGSGFGTAAGGGGGYFGGGGGASDGPGGVIGGGGGGAGFLGTGVTGVTTATNTGDGTVTITYPELTATVTTLTVSPSGSVAQGGPSVLTATTVSDPAGTPITGTVTFLDGATVLGTAPLVNGVATLTITLALGAHNLSASFGGATGVLTSASLSSQLEVTAILPDTGTDSAQLTGLALALLVLGSLVLIAARRRSVARIVRVEA